MKGEAGEVFYSMAGAYLWYFKRMMKKFYISVLFLAVIMLSACSLRTIPVYEVEKDEETGIIYNKEWDKKYSGKQAYYNATRGKLNVREGPGSRYKVNAYLKPREGGFVQECNFDLKWCLFDFGGMPQSGWVSMEFLEQGQVEYKR